jgi:ABC-type phosphate transport system substrate-binding protein
MTIRNRLMYNFRASSALLAAALAATAASEARADDCSTLPNPVYISGSSAVKPFAAKVGAELRQLDPPITVVYQGPGSCVGVDYLTKDPAPQLMASGVIFDNDGKDITGGCTVSSDTPADIGVSDVYPSSCGVETLPSGVTDFFGPIQAMTFAVPKTSTQTIISAEAAYLVYGFGNDSEVSPWVDDTRIEQRSASSGTQQMIGAAIKVPAAKFKGHANSGSGDVVTSLTTSAGLGADAADKAIGILATDRADISRDKLTVLGYQHYGQSCAYWPDSTGTSFDKANVRDGHYAIWGPLHMLARTSANANVKKVIDYLTGAETPSTFDLIQLEAKTGVVPECAMRVQRTKEIGELTSFMPTKSCECKFVKEATGGTPDGCTACEQASDCPSDKPVCNFKFCEVQ